MTEKQVYQGFPPVADNNSRVLICGSFPSVASRAQGFYYGHPRNRFWQIFCQRFGNCGSVEEKQQKLLSLGIALWDAVEKCSISGSDDRTIEAVTFNDLANLVKKCGIVKVYCNGAAAYNFATKLLGGIVPTVRLPSTSMRNVSFDKSKWEEAFDEMAVLCGVLPLQTK